TEGVRLVHDPVSRLAQQDHRGGMNDGKYNGSHGLNENRPAPWARINSKAVFKTDNERDEGENDKNAAHLPDERLPGCVMAVSADCLVQALVDAQQQTQGDKKQPSKLQPAALLGGMGAGRDCRAGVHWLDSTGRPGVPGAGRWGAV